MAINNHERVGKAMELVKAGVGPFVERELKSVYQEKALSQALTLLGEDRLNAKKPITDWDVAALLKVMWESWNQVFRKTLGPAERSLVQELRDHRNRWAHQEVFSSDNADRALDSAERLLAAVSAPQADEVRKIKSSCGAWYWTNKCAARSERAPAPLLKARSPPTSSLGARWS